MKEYLSNSKLVSIFSYTFCILNIIYFVKKKLFLSLKKPQKLIPFYLVTNYENFYFAER